MFIYFLLIRLQHKAVHVWSWIPCHLSHSYCIFSAESHLKLTTKNDNMIKLCQLWQLKFQTSNFSQPLLPLTPLDAQRNFLESHLSKAHRCWSLSSAPEQHNRRLFLVFLHLLSSFYSIFMYISMFFKILVLYRVFVPHNLNFRSQKSLFTAPNLEDRKKNKKKQKNSHFTRHKRLSPLAGTFVAPVAFRTCRRDHWSEPGEWGRFFGTFLGSQLSHKKSTVLWKSCETLWNSFLFTQKMVKC